jgi:hypothetical protein
MKFLTGSRLLLTVATLIVAAVIGLAVQLQYWRSHPDRAFVQITGRALPTGVHASAYRWSLNDNLFHVGHYWLLTGTSAELRQVMAGTSFAESTEDARWALPDVAHLFGRPRSAAQVAIGYEDNSPRNNWYWIFSGESEALYEHN